MRRLHERGGHVGDGRKGAPVVSRWVGVLDLDLVVVAQSKGGKSGAEARHALAVALGGDPRRGRGVLVFAPPAQVQLAIGRGFAAVDAPENGTDNVHLGEEDVDQGDTVPAEVGHRKDVAGDHTDRVGCLGRNASFVDELRNDGFGENVEEIEEKGWSLGVGKWLWRRGEEHGQGKLGLGNLQGFSKNGNELGKLFGY